MHYIINVFFIVTFILTSNCQLIDKVLIDDLACKAHYNTENTEKLRESIIFILGKDSGQGNDYYELAERFYRNNQVTSSHLLITSCMTLEAMIDYLNSHPTDNGRPWGQIQIVVHSNEWNGLGVSVFNNGPRVNVKSLSAALESNELSSLNQNIVDCNSTLVINACGLGRNLKLLKSLSSIFGHCDVVSSDYFVVYEERYGFIEKYEADYFYSFYKTGYKPSHLKLLKQLEERYPRANVNWLHALSNRNPKWKGDSYSYSFNIPVKWVVTFEASQKMPVLANDQAILNWLKQQDELMSIIENTKIPMSAFRWIINDDTYTFNDGRVVPAIYIKGKSTVLCVLKAHV